MRTVDQERLNVKKTHHVMALGRKGNKAEAATEKVRTFTGGIY